MHTIRLLLTTACRIIGRRRKRSGQAARDGRSRPFLEAMEDRTLLNTAPVALDDFYPVDQAGTLGVPADQGLLANDADADGDPLTVRLARGPAYGTVQLNGDGSFAYVPLTGFHGDDSFAYRASDGALDSDVATVTVRVRRVFPGAGWQTRAPAELGLDPARLSAFTAALGGRGVVVRHGYLVHTWGDSARRGDIASAVKPWYSHFLFEAVEEGLLAALDARAGDFEPRLDTLNPSLGFKDSRITFRQLANQTANYGVTEEPGTAFNYNDYQMALFFDTLMLGVYGSTWAGVDAQVLRPRLTNLLQLQDNPTFLAFGTGDRPGRMGVSPRDFARFGLLYLNGGNWSGTQVISPAHAALAVTSALPNSLPETAHQPAQMIPGQRTIGSSVTTGHGGDHLGSYSYAWWTNGVDRACNRLLPSLPDDAYLANGHDRQRVVLVVPSWDLVVSWNDTPARTWGQLNSVLGLLRESVNRPLIAFGADAGGEPRVRVFDALTRRERFSFLAFEPSFTGGVRVALADVTGDGALDVIAGTGPGAPARVRVFDGGGTYPVPAPVAGPLGDLTPYGPGFTGGVFVTAGDILAPDGSADLVVAPDAGFFPGAVVAPPLLAFHGATGDLLGLAWLYEPDFTGGVRVARADVSGDGVPDLIAAPGPGRPADVLVFSGTGEGPVGAFRAFDDSYTGGVFVAGGDVNGDGRADIAVGSAGGTVAQVRVFDSAAAGATPAALAELDAYAGFTGAVRLALVDLDGDGRPELVTTPGAGHEPRARAFDPLTGAFLGEALLYDPAFTGGLFVA